MNSKKEHQVWLACQNLRDQGVDKQEMSARRIQEELEALGWSRGSLRDIYKFKKTWLQHEHNAATPSPQTGHHLEVATPVGQNDLLLAQINEVSLEFIALQKKYDQAQKENKALLLAKHELELERQNHGMKMGREPHAAGEIQKVVAYYEKKLEHLRQENTRYQIEISDLKQTMEQKRHQYIVDIDKLKIEKNKLQKIVDQHLLKL